MKVNKTNALKSIQHLTNLAEARMIDGIDKYGEEVVLEGKNQDLKEEFEQEIADAINYMVFAYEKFKNALILEKKIKKEGKK
jgi:hypothetical protein